MSAHTLVLAILTEKSLLVVVSRRLYPGSRDALSLLRVSGLISREAICIHGAFLRSSYVHSVSSDSHHDFIIECVRLLRPYEPILNFETLRINGPMSMVTAKSLLEFQASHYRE
jgi:hypothetical protein